MKRTILLIAIVIAVVSAIRMPLLGIPFERDEGSYVYIAWRNGFGELPYRDWIDQKPPGVFYVYQLALHLPLEPVHAVHFMGLVFSVGSACALYILALRFTNPFWAMISTVLLAFLSADPLVEGPTANTELFMLLPLILSQVATFSAVSENRWKVPLAILAGALTGLAVAFKQVGIFNWPVLVFSYWLFVAGEGRLRKTIQFAAWAIVGGAAVWGSIGGYFMLHHGWHELIFQVFTYNFHYIQSTPWPKRLALCLAALKTIARSQLLIWTFSAAALATLCITGRVKVFLFLAAWMVASMTGVSLSGYNYPHYFQQLLPVLCLAAAIGAAALDDAEFWKTAPTWSRKVIIGATLVVLPVIVVYPFIFAYSSKEAIGKIYPNDPFFAEMPEVAKRLDQITRPDEKVFVFGAEPEALFYARRVSATRYIFLFHLYTANMDAKEKQIKTAAEISASRPTAALYLPNGTFYIEGDEHYFNDWSATYLHKYFHRDTYITMDQSNAVHLIPAASTRSLPDSNGQHVYGALYVRNSK